MIDPRFQLGYILKGIFSVIGCVAAAFALIAIFTAAALFILSKDDDGGLLGSTKKERAMQALCIGAIFLVMAFFSFALLPTIQRFFPH